MAERQPGERAAGVGIGVWRPLAGEVRREQEPLGRGLPPSGLGVENSEVPAERVPHPRRRAGRAEHHAHRVPGCRDGVAEDVDTRLGLGCVRGQHRKHDPGRAEDDRDRTGGGDPDTERGGGLVAGARDLRRLVRGREPFEGKFERLEHLDRPAPVGDVEEERPGGVGGVDQALSREAEANVVLRQQHVADPGVRLGLVPAEPEQFRGGEAGERAVAGQFDQPFEPDPRLDLCALGRRSLVVPEDRGPQDAIVGAEHDEAVHLTGQPDRPLGQTREAGHGRVPPILGVLLGVAGLRRRQLVALLGGGQHLPVVRDRNGLDAARADVEADENCVVGQAPRAA